MFCRVTNKKETLIGIQNYIKRRTKLCYYILLRTDIKLKFDCKTFDKIFDNILYNKDTARCLVFLLMTYN